MMTSLSEEWKGEGTVRIPLLGQVAAGQPLEVFSLEEGLDVPESLWTGKKVFALRVRGQSMIEAGIRDGDYLIIEPCDTADDGRTVVAEVDGRVTVKKLFREPGGRIRLQPANSEMLPFIVDGEDVRICGVVAGVLRKYGFGSNHTSPPAAVPSPPARAQGRNGGTDESTLDLALNVIDTQLERWRMMAEDERLRIDAKGRARIAAMGRDLQALRDWCARTSRPSLRRALIEDAQRIMVRMQRFLRAFGVELPDLVVH